MHTNEQFWAETEFKNAGQKTEIEYLKLAFIL